MTVCNFSRNKLKLESHFECINDFFINSAVKGLGSLDAMVMFSQFSISIASLQHHKKVR